MRIPRRISKEVERIILLMFVVISLALLIVDWTKVPDVELRIGEVAPRTVTAARTFHYTDEIHQQERIEAARAAILPVFVYRADLLAQLQVRIAEAFAIARTTESDPTAKFIEALGVHLPTEDLAALERAGFPQEAEQLSFRLLDRAMSAYVITDRAELPAEQRLVSLIELRGDSHREFRFDPTMVRTPSEAREQVAIGILESSFSKETWVSAAAIVARSMVRANLSFDELQTRERQERATAEIPLEPITIKRGTILFRQGDVLTREDVERYTALQNANGPHRQWTEPSVIAGFLTLFLTVLVRIGLLYIPGLSGQIRELLVIAGLLVLTAITARLVDGSAETIVASMGFEGLEGSVNFIIPVAGAAILVRWLFGVGWALLFTMASSTIVALILDSNVLMLAFYLVSGMTAIGSVEQGRERLAILRGGVFVGAVGAAAAVSIHLVSIFFGDSEASSIATMGWLTSLICAFIGGLSSGFLVLGLLPIVESLGFVTDYRLMELANLNHPLLRQLMLRAPGSYHHSVIVGTLAEAACESVGGNALLAKVASYFHDVGKTLKPQYFVENQRSTVNRHDGLPPRQSARIIISHVTEGGRMANEHKLPQPIIDNIYMHHGTGLLQYFYDQARAMNPEISEADFRYPGPKPNTKEAGIIMLADKVEAATRTIQEPTEARIREMIHRIVNSVMADGQFDECPLTFQEIHRISDTFVRVLVGIHHQRIEYPATRSISRGETELGTATPVIERVPVQTTTSHLPSLEDEENDPVTDWESVVNLPHRENDR